MKIKIRRSATMPPAALISSLVVSVGMLRIFHPAPPTPIAQRVRRVLVRQDTLRTPQMRMDKIRGAHGTMNPLRPS
jgi:hypothetical protein